MKNNTKLIMETWRRFLNEGSGVNIDYPFNVGLKKAELSDAHVDVGYDADADRANYIVAPQLISNISELIICLLSLKIDYDRAMNPRVELEITNNENVIVEIGELTSVFEKLKSCTLDRGLLEKHAGTDVYYFNENYSEIIEEITADLPDFYECIESIL